MNKTGNFLFSVRWEEEKTWRWIPKLDKNYFHLKQRVGRWNVTSSKNVTVHVGVLVLKNNVSIFRLCSQKPIGEGRDGWQNYRFFSQRKIKNLNHNRFFFFLVFKSQKSLAHIESFIIFLLSCCCCFRPIWRRIHHLLHFQIKFIFTPRIFFFSSKWRPQFDQTNVKWKKTLHFCFN